MTRAPRRGDAGAARRAPSGIATNSLLHALAVPGGAAMAVAPHRRSAPRVLLRWGGPALLLVGAAAYFRLSLPFGLELADSGMILLPSRQVLDGAVPYRDFPHAYGPSLFYLNGVLLRLVGAELYGLRLAMLVVKLGTIAAVYLCARQVAAPAVALAAAALATVMWGAPWWLFHTPYANHFALTLCLLGLWASLALPARLTLRCAVAGLCFGLAASFKQTSGLFALMALAVSLLLAPGEGAGRPPAWLAGILGRAIRWLTLAVAAVLAAAYLAPRSDAWTALVVGAPAAALLALAAHREWRGLLPVDDRAAGAAGVLATAAAAAAPLFAYAGYFAAQGALGAFAFDTLSGLPQRLEWFEPYFRPAWPAWVAAAGVIAAVAAARRGRGAAWGGAALAAVAVCGAIAAGGFGWDAIWFGALALLVPAVVWGGLWALRSAAPPSAALVRFAAFGAISLLFLYPSGDFWHIAMAAPAFLPLAAGLGDRWLAGGRRAAAIVGATTVLLLASPFVRSLVAVRAAGGTAPDSGPLRGIVDPSPRGQAARVVSEALLRRPGAPLLVTTADSLFYLLAGRDSALPAGEFILYLIGFGLIDDDVARALLPESQVVEALQRVRPTLVEAQSTRHLFRRVYPQAAAIIDRHYRVAVDAPPFQILEWAA
ncbi:hypothetical protein KF840_12000 [bacterium]|nr:hypothetical protein [bacterium]